jgi:hypothetical protein
LLDNPLFHGSRRRANTRDAPDLRGGGAMIWDTGILHMIDIGKIL